MISNGDKVLVGLSGGADSVMLLLFLLEYSAREDKSFPILCVHVNHGIRGDEAMRDEAFSKDLVSASSALFESVRINVPNMAAEWKNGLEEAARKVRYSVFDDIIRSRNDISCIAVAHNATDNVETVLLNMLRGTGLNGLCGIKPTRDNIVRPLIGISKKEIVELLDSFEIPYVTDSTNLSSEYNRNYIRNDILPLLERISSNTEATVFRMTENLLEDLNYLDKAADEFIKNYAVSARIKASDLAQLPQSIFVRVMSKLIHGKTGLYPEEKHIMAIKKLIDKENFSFSLPGQYDFCMERGKCRFIEKNKANPLRSMIFPLKPGENIIDGTNLVVYIGHIDETSLKVYNFSIKASVSSDIIDNGIHLRVKRDGDAYKYSGITHKLKKVFNDRNIPSFEREYIPIISDNNGILWVPGLSVRDGVSVGDNLIPITLCYKAKDDEVIEMFTALKRV